MSRRLPHHGKGVAFISAEEVEAVSRGIAHAARTPLWCVSNLVRLLARREDEGQKSLDQRHLDDIQMGVEEVSFLMDVLSSYGKMANAFAPAEVCMDDLIQECLKSLRGLLTRIGVQTMVRELPPCWGERDLLAVLWASLLRHVLHFAEPGTGARLVISGSLQGGMCSYTISWQNVQVPPGLWSWRDEDSPGMNEAMWGGFLVVSRHILDRHQGTCEAREGRIEIALPGVL